MAVLAKLVARLTKFVIALSVWATTSKVGRVTTVLVSMVVVVLLLRQVLNGYLSWALIASPTILLMGVLIVAVKPHLIRHAWIWKYVWGFAFAGLSVALIADWTSPITEGPVPYLGFLPWDLSRAWEFVLLAIGSLLALFVSLSCVFGRQPSLVIKRSVGRTVGFLGSRGSGFSERRSQKMERARLSSMREAAIAAGEVYNEVPAAAQSVAAKVEESSMDWDLPDKRMLGAEYVAAQSPVSDAEIQRSSKSILATLQAGGVESPQITGVTVGPNTTTYRVAHANGRPVAFNEEMEAALNPSVFAPENQANGVLSAVRTNNHTRAQIKLGSVTNGSLWDDYCHKADLPIAIGKDAYNKPLFLDIRDLNTFLIANGDIVERSACLHNIILSLLMSRNPEQVRLAMIGPDNGTLVHYSHLPHIYTPHATDRELCARVIEALCGDIVNRTSDSTPVVVAIEELNILLEQFDNSTMERLSFLILRGPQKGIYFVGTIDEADNRLLSRNLMAGFRSRLSFRTESRVASIQTINTGDALNLNGKGGMAFVKRGRTLAQSGQIATASLREIRSIANYWTAIFNTFQLPRLEVQRPSVTPQSRFKISVKAPQIDEPPKPPPEQPIISAERAAYNGTQEPVAPTAQEHPPIMQEQSVPQEHYQPPPREAPNYERRETADFDEPMPQEPPPIVQERPVIQEHYEPPQSAPHEPPPVFKPPQKKPRRSRKLPLPPPTGLASATETVANQSEIEHFSRRIEQCLVQHGVNVKVERAMRGPTVTTYAISPGWKESGRGRTERVRVDTILKLEKDLALELGTPDLRLEGVIPGESVMALEIPNVDRNPVALRSLLESPKWADFVREARLPVALGRNGIGEPQFADLDTMPHLLVAGSTGSGKSVCVNSIITSLLLTKQPQEVRLVLIDPKRVELTNYNGIPHLMTPVIVESRQAVAALKALIVEIERRFELIKSSGKRGIDDYNKVSSEPLSYIVVVIDELADLMLTCGAEFEALLVRLAQLGRAAGLRFVAATQRPSVDVVTGLIKANLPSRICFAVMSSADSRTVLDRIGGEKLLGRGDMLFAPIGEHPARVQGVYMSDREIEQITNHWLQYGDEVLDQLDLEETAGAADGEKGGAMADDDDEMLINHAMELLKSQRSLSVSYLQRRLRVGYPRAARLMDTLEDLGKVGPGEPGKPRIVL